MRSSRAAFAVWLVLLVHAPMAAGQLRRSEAPGETRAVLDAEKAWLGADAFWPLAKAGDPATRRYALRALGRLEDPANVPGLLALGRSRDALTPAVADAIVQSLYGFDPAKDPNLISTVSTWFLAIADTERRGSAALVSLPLGRIKYATDGQFRAAEGRLLETQEKYEFAARTEPEFGWYQEAQAALESLFRLNPQFGPPTEAALVRLRSAVRATHAPTCQRWHSAH